MWQAAPVTFKSRKGSCVAFNGLSKSPGERNLPISPVPAINITINPSGLYAKKRFIIYERFFATHRDDDYALVRVRIAAQYRSAINLSRNLFVDTCYH